MAAYRNLCGSLKRKRSTIHRSLSDECADSQYFKSATLPTLSNVPDYPLSNIDLWCATQGFQTMPTSTTQTEVHTPAQFAWEFERDGGWMPYKPEHSEILEQAWNKKQSHATIAMNAHSTNEVSLDEMVETNGLTRFPRRVRRCDLSQVSNLPRPPMPPMPPCTPTFCELCIKDTIGQSFCGDCGKRKGCLPLFKNLNHLAKACQYVVDTDRSELDKAYPQERQLHRFVLTSSLVTKAKKRLGLHTIEKSLRAWRATQNRFDNADLVEFPKQFDYTKHGFDAVVACRDRRTKKEYGDTTRSSSSSNSSSNSSSSSNSNSNSNSSTNSNKTVTVTSPTINGVGATCIPQSIPVAMHVEDAEPLEEVQCDVEPIETITSLASDANEGWFGEDCLSDLVNTASGISDQIKPNLAKEASHQHLRIVSIHDAQKEKEGSTEDAMMVSSTSSVSSTASSFIKECTNCGEDTVGERFCDQCGKQKDMDVPMGTPSVTLNSRPTYEHAAFLEYLSKRTPRSIMDSRNLAAYKARANWYNAGSEAGSIVWHMRHNPGGDPTYKAQQTVLNDLLAFIKLMPHYVFASRFQYLVVDKSRVQGRVVEDTEVAGCYVHYLSFRVVEIYFEHAQFGNDIHHKYLKRCMPLHVNALYAELDATLQRALEPTATACTLLTTTYPHTTISPSTTTNPPTTAPRIASSSIASSSIASSCIASSSIVSSTVGHPQSCSDVTHTHNNTTMVQNSGMLSSTSNTWPPLEDWEPDLLSRSTSQQTSQRLQLPQPRQKPQRLHPPQLRQTPPPPLVPLANCEVCNETTVGAKFCDTCGYPKGKGQQIRFDSKRHVRLACKHLRDMYNKAGLNPRFDGGLLRTLMNTSKKGQAIAEDTLLSKLREYRKQCSITAPVDPTFDIGANGFEVLQAYHSFLQNQYYHHQRRHDHRQHVYVQRSNNLQALNSTPHLILTS